MIDRRVFSLAVVVCCLLAMGSLSTSLESTVETPPGEAIELDYASLPLSVGEASELKRSYHAADSAEDQGDASSSRSAEPGSGSQHSGRAEFERSSGVSETEQSRGDSAERSGGASETDRSGEVRPAERNQGLLAVLEAFLSAIASSLLWLVAVVIGLVSLTQRDRILAWVKRRFGGCRPGIDDATGGTGDDRSVHPPRNIVERSWLELLSRADVDPDPSATPRETAAKLVGAGFDRRSVWELTELFEEARYDDAPVTPTRVHRALSCLQQCRQQEGKSE